MTGMMKTLILGLAALTLASPALAAAGLSADAVDVYPRGAHMSMEVEATETLRLELPATLDEKTLTVEGLDGVTIGEWSVRTVPATDWLPAALEGLKREVEQARSEVVLHESRLSSLEQAARQVEKMEPEATSPEEAERFIDRAMRKREALELKLRTSGQALEKARDRLQVLEKLLAKRRPQVTDRYLDLTATCKGTGKVLIRAWTDQAGWTPRYRLDLAGGTGQVTGRLEGLVQQKSGLPWQGTVTVHSSQPRSSLSVPELRPLVVDFAQPRPFLGEARSMKAMSLAVDEMEAPASNRIETMTDVALSGTGNVPGDGMQKALTLETFALNGHVSLVAIPELSPRGWVLWDMETADRAFLPAQVELSIDGSPSGRTRMPALGAGQPLSLAFGTSPLIKVDREDLLPREGSSWIGKGRLERGYAMTVTNGLDRTAEVTVRDRIPVSVQDKIKIENIEISLQPTERDDEGLLTWKLALAPGESTKVTVRYRVTYPSDKDITFEN